MDTRLLRLEAFKPVKLDPSPLKVPVNWLAALVIVFGPAKRLDPISEAPFKLASAFEGVFAPVPPREIETIPVLRLSAFSAVKSEPVPLKVPAKTFEGLVSRIAFE